jgi:O-antigen/teichoic acid export membrane protein
MNKLTALSIPKKNLVATLLNVGLSAVANLLFQPIIARYLPVGSLTIVSIANSLISYLGLITAPINSALSRFVLSSLVKGKRDAANEYTTTLLMIAGGFLVILAAVCIPASFLVDHLIRVPASMTVEVQRLFLMVTIAFILFQVRLLSQISFFTSDRLYLTNLTSLAETLIQIAVSFALLVYVGSYLSFIGSGILVAAIVTSLYCLSRWKALMPHVTVAREHWAPHRAKEVLSVAGWTILDSMGMMLTYQTDVLIVNRYLPLHESDIYSQAVLLAYLVRLLSGSISSTYGPQYVKLVASENFAELRHFILGRLRHQSFLVSIPVGILAGSGPILYEVWLGPRFVGAAQPMQWLIIPLFFSMSLMPLSGVWNAMYRNRVPSLVNFGSGICAIAGVILAMQLGWGLIGAAAMVSAASFIRALFFSPPFIGNLTKENPWNYARVLVIPTIACALLGVVSYAAVQVVPLYKLWQYVLLMLPIAAVYALVVYKLGLLNMKRLPGNQELSSS